MNKLKGISVAGVLLALTAVALGADTPKKPHRPLTGPCDGTHDVLALIELKSSTKLPYIHTVCIDGQDSQPSNEGLINLYKKTVHIVFRIDSSQLPDVQWASTLKNHRASSVAMIDKTTDPGDPSFPIDAWPECASARTVNTTDLAFDINLAQCASYGMTDGSGNMLDQQFDYALHLVKAAAANEAQVHIIIDPQIINRPSGVGASR